MDQSMTWIHRWSGSLKVDDTANKRHILHFSLPQCRASRKLSFDILTTIRELLILIFHSCQPRVNNLPKNNEREKINFFVFSYFNVALVVTNRKDFSRCKTFNTGSCTSAWLFSYFLRYFFSHICWKDIIEPRIIEKWLDSHQPVAYESPTQPRLEPLNSVLANVWQNCEIPR